MFKSNTMLMFEKSTDFKRMKPDKVKFIDDVYFVCERNYDAGGDLVVECFEPNTIRANFESLEDVKRYIEVRLSRALDCREGNDDDPELETWRRFQNSNWEV